MDTNKLINVPLPEPRKITRENFIEEFGGEEIRLNLPQYTIAYLYSNEAVLVDNQYYNVIGKPLTTLEQVHALYRALMLQEFKK